MQQADPEAAAPAPAAAAPAAAPAAAAPAAAAPAAAAASADASPPSSRASTPQAQIIMPSASASSSKQVLATARSPSTSGSSGGGGAAHQQVPIDGRRAAFAAQAGALFRKNAVFQRRNACSNLCLLSAPIFFCLLLFIIQVLVNRLLLAGEDYECGCRCVKCCWQGNLDNCTAVPYGTCQGTCLQKDPTQCGVEYSSARQSYFCSIPHTSVWPAVSQTPRLEFRAAPQKPRVALMVTGGADAAFASEVAAALVPRPNVTAASLLKTQAYLKQFQQDFGADNRAVMPGELLPLLGLRLGTSSRVGAAGLYIETAIAPGGSLEALWPQGTCKQMGFGDQQFNISLATMLSAMINASNPAPAAAALNGALRGVFGGGGGGGMGGGFAAVGGLSLNCSETQLSPQPSAEAVQRALYCGYRQARCAGNTALNEYDAAYDLGDSGPASFAPKVYYNDTFGIARGTAPTVYQRIPASVNALVNAWLSAATGGRATAQLLGVQETPKPASKVRLDFSSLLGPLFFTWVLQMLLPIYLMQMVYEKEKRLRMMMKMHGLGDGAYWVVMYAWFAALYLAYLAVFMVFGSAIGLNMFRKNSYGLQIITYLLWGNNMIAQTFLLSCFFASSRTATVFAYLVVFGTGIVGQLLLGTLVESGRWFVWLLQLYPSFALYRALYEYGAYAFLAVYKDSAGMTAAALRDPQNGLAGVWGILAAEWVLFMALAWYLEQVFASGTGNRKHPLYFLQAFSNKGPLRRVTGGGKHVVQVADEAEDVALERARVAGLTDYLDNPIVIRDLRKVYPGLDGQPPKLAVKTLNLGIERGECFGLLGPNGAGKSTSINMMVGLLEPSEGTAVIGGYDITRDMDAIYHLMGVCPQHDLLWETLTGEEHLLFYGRLKGYTGKQLAAAVEAGLRSVNLWNNRVGAKQARAYSGGMKRRLSVAISFMGQPLVVYLDEPSTGLDPASRRNLWDVVKANKRDRAIVLTTHSMEEAEMLCDRLGIFVDGQLVCIGNPKELTSRYGGYLVFTLTVPGPQEEAARAFVAGMSPGARLTYAVGGTLKFELPADEVTLARVFECMAQAKQQLQVLDWGVAHATLEEVFIKFARQIGAKAGD